MLRVPEGQKGLGWDPARKAVLFFKKKTPVAAVTVYSAPDDGRRVRPKHVEHTCSC